MSKMFPIIIAHAKFFFQDLDGKGPSLMSIGSDATANGYITYKSVKKKKKKKEEEDLDLQQYFLLIQLTLGWI